MNYACAITGMCESARREMIKFSNNVKFLRFVQKFLRFVQPVNIISRNFAGKTSQL